MAQAVLLSAPCAARLLVLNRRWSVGQSLLEEGESHALPVIAPIGPAPAEIHGDEIDPRSRPPPAVASPVPQDGVLAGVSLRPVFKSAHDPALHVGNAEPHVQRLGQVVVDGGAQAERIRVRWGERHGDCRSRLSGARRQRALHGKDLEPRWGRVIVRAHAEL